MKKWFLVPLFLLLAAIMVFTGCETPSTQTVTTTTTTTTSTTSTTTTPTEPYGTITGMAADFGYETYDPVRTSTWDSLIFEMLVRIDEDLTFSGGVVDSWDMSEDGCTWTFHVHPGNHFTNGDPVTAADLKFSVDYFGITPDILAEIPGLTSNSPWSLYLRYNLKSSRVVDDLTYEYVTNHPESTLLASFGATPILDKAAFDSLGRENYFKNPIGSGPWKFLSLVTKQEVRYEANTSYWRTSERPHYQFYIEKCVPELATRISMFKTGQADILGLDDYARLRELANEGWATVSAGINGTDSFAFQATWLPEAGATGDIRIRQAMSYALNRQEICDTWYSGYAIPGGQFFMPTGVFGWTDELTPDPYDPDHARALIAEAGYPDAFTKPVITIFCQAPDKDRLLYYSSYWTAVGLQIDIKVIATTAYWGYLFARPTSTSVNVGWIWFWKSWGYSNSVYHSANMYTSTGVHGTANDPTADAMYREITNQKDYATAWAKMSAFQLYVKTLYVNIGVVEYQNVSLYNQHTLGGYNGRNWEGGYIPLAGITHPVS
jgi:peptide/nickel transport system substrate-binding protein